jgi:ATP-dependent Lon protease
MNKNGWNCQALILRGRNGVGKTSIVKAIAKSMSISLFEYASDVDQLQKMK